MSFSFQIIIVSLSFPIKYYESESDEAFRQSFLFIFIPTVDGLQEESSVPAPNQPSYPMAADHLL